MSEFTSAGLTAGQLNAIVKKLGGEEGALRLLRGEIEVVVRKWLVALAPVTVALTQPHNPDEFYQTREGLWVDRDFRTRVVAMAKPIASAEPVTLKRSTLSKNMTDAQTEAELGEGHLFGEDQAGWIIAEMIAKQPNGEAGDLENTGANLFYLASCVVSVRWYAGRRSWGVSAWCRVLRWSAGGVAFSRN